MLRRKSFNLLSIFALLLTSVFILQPGDTASAHTQFLAWDVNGSDVTFYAGTYHGIGELLSGGMIVDGVTYPFTGLVEDLPANVDGLVGGALGSNAPWNPSTMESTYRWQTVTVSGLTSGAHSISSTSSAPEAPAWGNSAFNVDIANIGGGPAAPFTDGRINRNEFSACAAIYTANYSSGTGLHIYKIDEVTGKGTLSLEITPEMIAAVGDAPAANTVLGQSADGVISAHRLNTGEFQVNCGPNSEGYEDVVIFDTLSPLTSYYTLRFR
ncbi:MAG: hypothetical protein Kow0077_15660 [Anaerolineae bacterium]